MSFSELNLCLWHPFTSKAPVLVDVGAHHGSVSRSFADKGWSVIAFEPEGKNRSAFLANLAGYENVTCIPKAVSDSSGDKVPFYVSEEHFGIHSLKPFHETHKLAYQVETVTLKECLAELDILNVTLLKVDTEGADFLALEGFDFQKYHPELIMVEFMDERSVANFGYTHHDVVTYMAERGYVTFVSEWAPIKEYGREGVAGEPHTWLQCVPYPLGHDPAWGNLIFVPEQDNEKFARTLDAYLRSLNAPTPLTLKSIIKKIPGAKALHRILTANS